MRAVLSWQTDGQTVTLTRCLRLSLLRDRYQPFAELRAEFAAEADCPLPLDVSLTVGGVLLHRGLVREASRRQENGQCILSVHSQSYSAALVQNQLVPGVHSDVTLISLMTTYQLPNMTYEQVPDPISYIYVRENTAMWDAVIAYSYKRSGSFPYLRTPDLLCVSPQTGTDAVVLPEHRILRISDQTETGGIISRIEMAEIDGTPGRFVMDNPEAARRNIVRVRQIQFDKQYADRPMGALAFRIAMGNRRLYSKTVVYDGCCGEDIGDLIRCGSLTARADRIRLTADEKGFRTELRFYYDDFCNAPSSLPQQ
ncbi:MAG: hypothetical protein K6E36_11410 [Oscillospiraceae bacterium]|nr:hypothetical protein [Oscillospiraceae bacterium]